MHVARKLLKGQSRWALSEFEGRWAEELPQVSLVSDEHVLRTQAAILLVVIALHCRDLCNAVSPLSKFMSS